MHIHLVGIAGSMTAPLAISLKKQGHLVTGSDQDKIYPPFSQQLKKASISVNQTVINSHIDLAIIGSSFLAFNRTKEEYQQILSKKIPYISATNYISQYLIKKNSILVAGSYGKTTITAAVAFLLQHANLDPAYFFGGQSLNRLESLHFSDSDWSVVEADESINGLDTQAKFLYYPVKYLILTSALWEHKESYQSETDNFLAFRHLLERIPTDGFLIYNQNDPSIKALLDYTNCPKIPYHFTSLKNNLIGEYNQNNLAAVETLGHALKLTPKVVTTAIKKFKGIKRRLEFKAQKQDIIFIDDFAQSPQRILAALKALSEHYPSRPLKVFFEAHASFLQYRSSLSDLGHALNQATETTLYRLKYTSNLDSTKRLSARDFLAAIPHCHYLPLSENVIKHYQDTLKSGDILVHFSSGGADGLKIFHKIINSF